MNASHVTFLMKSKGRENHLLWLEGKRLSDAGFAPGTKVMQVWEKDKLTLLADEINSIQVPEEYRGKDIEYGTITGKKKRTGKINSLVRLEGTRVINTFGKHSPRVQATYTPGKIVVERFFDEGNGNAQS
jgi:hypothetical protein